MKHTHRQHFAPSIMEHRLLYKFGEGMSEGEAHLQETDIRVFSEQVRDVVGENRDDPQVIRLRETLQEFLKEKREGSDLFDVQLIIAELVDKFKPGLTVPNLSSNDAMRLFALESGMVSERDLVHIDTEGALSKEKEKTGRGKVYQTGDIRTRYVNGLKFLEVCVAPGTLRNAMWAPYAPIETIEQAHARKEWDKAERRADAEKRAEEAREADLRRNDSVYGNSWRTRNRLAKTFGGTGADYLPQDMKPRARYTDRTGKDALFRRRSVPEVVIEETVLESPVSRVRSTHLTSVPKEKEETPVPEESSTRSSSPEGVPEEVLPVAEPVMERIAIDSETQSATLTRVNQELHLEDGVVLRKLKDDSVELRVDKKQWGMSSDGSEGVLIVGPTLEVKVSGPGVYTLTSSLVSGQLQRVEDSLFLDLQKDGKKFETKWGTGTRPEVPKAVPPTSEGKGEFGRMIWIDHTLKEETQKQMTETKQEWVSIPSGKSGFTYRMSPDGFFAKNAKGEVFTVDKEYKTVKISGPETSPTNWIQRVREQASKWKNFLSSMPTVAPAAPTRPEAAPIAEEPAPIIPPAVPETKDAEPGKEEAESKALPRFGPSAEELFQKVEEEDSIREQIKKAEEEARKKQEENTPNTPDFETWQDRKRNIENARFKQFKDDLVKEVGEVPNIKNIGFHKLSMEYNVYLYFEDKTYKFVHFAKDYGFDLVQVILYDDESDKTRLGFKDLSKRIDKVTPSVEANIIRGLAEGQKIDALIPKKISPSFRQGRIVLS